MDIIYQLSRSDPINGPLPSQRERERKERNPIRERESEGKSTVVWGTLPENYEETVETVEGSSFNVFA